MNPSQQKIRKKSKNMGLYAGSTIVIVQILLAIFADKVLIYKYDQPVYSEAAKYPSIQHIMGTDTLGRDLFSRILYAGRVSLGIGFGVQLFALVIGVSLGSFAGYKGGSPDYIITRLLDFSQAFPYLLLVIIIMVTVGSGIANVFWVLILTGWMETCRLTRVQVLSHKERDYVLASYALGTSDFQIVIRHILPNALQPIVISTTLGIPRIIFAEANLSFIGIGVTPPLPSWGQMIGEYYRYIPSLWHLALFPTLMVGITMFAFVLIGDGLINVFDPRKRFLAN